MRDETEISLRNSSADSEIEFHKKSQIYLILITATVGEAQLLTFLDTGELNYSFVTG